jgi:hypothetical protein
MNLVASAVREEGPAMLQWQGKHVAPARHLAERYAHAAAGQGKHVASKVVAGGASTSSSAATRVPSSFGGDLMRELGVNGGLDRNEEGWAEKSGLLPSVEAGVRVHGAQGDSDGAARAKGGSGEGEQLKPRAFLDEQLPVHRKNPRNKVADLMRELGVNRGEIPAEKSRTHDPYDPWKPDSEDAGVSTKSRLRPVLHAGRARTGGRGLKEGEEGEEASADERYATAAKVFKAASAAYKAADKTWNDLEAKAKEASNVQALLHGNEQRASKADEDAAASTASARPVPPEQAMRAVNKGKSVAGSEKELIKRGGGGGSTSEQDKESAAASSADLNEFFDTLIDKRVAVSSWVLVVVCIEGRRCFLQFWLECVAMRSVVSGLGRNPIRCVMFHMSSPPESPQPHTFHPKK